MTTNVAPETVETTVASTPPTVAYCPRRMTIDRACALFVLMLAACKAKGIEFTDAVLTLQFLRYGFITDKRVDRIEGEQGYVLDNGKRKYKTAGYPSALVRALQAMGFEREMVMDELVQIINRDNKDQGLKRETLSIPWIMREMQKSQYTWTVREVTLASVHVVQMYLRSRTNSVREFREMKNCEELQQLLKFVDNQTSIAFTLGCYIADMWVAGVPVEGIVVRASFWADAKREIDRNSSTLGGLLDAATKKQHGKVCVLFTDHEDLGRRALQNELGEAIVIINGVKADNDTVNVEDTASERPNIVVMSRGNGRVFSLDRAGAFLTTLEGRMEEGGKWFYDQRLGSGALFNGTEGFPCPGTYLDVKLLVELINHIGFNAPLSTDPATFVATCIECMPANRFNPATREETRAALMQILASR